MTHDSKKFVVNVIAASAITLLAFNCGGCGGGGGGGGGSGTKLNLSPPGTFTHERTTTAKDNVFVLLASEGITTDDVAGTVTLSTPARSYQVGNVIIGDGTTTRFANRINNVNVVGGNTVLSVEQAYLNDVIQEGSISLLTSPDWRTGEQLKPRLGKPLPQYKTITLLDIEPDGSINLNNFCLFDFAILPGGNIDWAQSSLMGLTVSPGERKDDDGVIKSETSSCGAGHVTATIVSGKLRVVPTFKLDTVFGGSDGLRIHGGIAVHVIYGLKVEFAVSGQVSLEVARDLFPTIRIPVTIPGTPPIYLTLELNVKAGFNLSAQVAGTATMEYASEYDILTDLTYTTNTGLNATQETKLINETKDVSYDLTGSMTGELFLEPKAMVRFYEVIGPYIYLHPYIRATLTYPWQTDMDELYLGISGGVGLELFYLFGTLDIKSQELFDIYNSWDLYGPRSTPPTNAPPTAIGQTVVAPPSGTTINLLGSDLDGDSLSYSIINPPSHGKLGTLNHTTGQVFYQPSPGYTGPDTFTFSVYDGKVSSDAATVTISVVGGHSPEPWFYIAFTGLKATVDASISTDAEDATSALQVRWDWTNDGVWDTTWSNVKTASHTFAASGVYVVVMQVVDTSGMISRAYYVADLSDVAPPPPQPPTAPTYLVATSVSSSQINLVWEDKSADETGFIIEAKPDAGSTFSFLTTVGPNITSWSHTGLAPSTTRFYRVCATNAVGDSTWSNEAYATTESITPPTNNPPNITFYAPSSLSLTVTAAQSTVISFDVRAVDNDHPYVFWQFYRDDVNMESAFTSSGETVSYITGFPVPGVYKIKAVVLDDVSGQVGGTVVWTVTANP